MQKSKRKRKIILIIFTVVLSYYLYSFHTENKKYRVLNEIFSDTELNFEKICNRQDYVHYNKELFNSFSSADKPSVWSQYSIQYLFGTLSDFGSSNKIKPDKIKFINSKGKEQFSTILQDCSTELQEIKRGDKVIWEINSNSSISLPILSSNGKLAIIQITENCGMLCSSSSTYLFKKVNGKWHLEKQTMSWIS